MVVNYQNAKVYIDDVVLLDHVTLQAQAGDFIFLTGKVGTGKTSLLRSMYGMARVKGDSTQVLDFDMQHIKSKHLPELRRRLGIVFQDFQLLPDRTVYANLEFVLKATKWKVADIPGRIAEVLGIVRLEDKASQFPHELSGGEQQRVAIARAILNNPALILADEPTGNLDYETSYDIVQTLYNLSQKGTTVIMTTHNQAMLQQVEARQWLCADHTIAEVKTHQSEVSEEVNASDN